MEDRYKAKKLYTSSFGIEYTKRSDYDSVDGRDSHTILETGQTITQALTKILSHTTKVERILEVGAGAGHNLELLSKMGYQNLCGTDIQEYALSLGRIKYPKVELICSDSLSLPFKNDSFDFVLTRMHLIHFHPQIIDTVIKELIRVSSKYIAIIEYYDVRIKEVIWRGERNVVWKQDFAKRFKQINSNVSVAYEEIIPIKESKYGIKGLAYQHSLIAKQ